MQRVGHTCGRAHTDIGRGRPLSRLVEGEVALRVDLKPSPAKREGRAATVHLQTYPIFVECGFRMTPDLRSRCTERNPWIANSNQKAVSGAPR